MMRLSMGLMALLLLLLAAPASAASFDCAKASSEIEKRICANSALGAADELLADSYRRARERDPANDFTIPPKVTWRTATQALINVTHRYIELLADHGLEDACERQPALLGGINVMNGQLTNKAVALAHGMPFSPPKV